MNRIFVNKDIELLGLVEGDILFYDPEDDMYEKIKKDSIKQKGMSYEISESIKYNISFLEEYLESDHLRGYDHIVEEEYDDIEITTNIKDCHMLIWYESPLYFNKIYTY